MEQENKKEKFNLTMRTAESLLYDGEVYALTSYNNKGKFDMLAFHSNFISIIEKSVTIYPEKDAPQEFTISKGVLRVSENEATIFLGIEIIQTEKI